MSDVFISYKRENLAVVNRLVEALRAESVDVWWDQDIPPNAPWEATIEKALAAAKLIIVAWSPASVASDNVKAEARWARGQGRLLQVFVEACDPPLFFGERQGVDLKGWSGGATDPAFRALLQAVRDGRTPTRGETAGAESFVAPPPALPAKPSIAVMPFANLSGDPEQNYFADGMVVEIVSALSRIRSIFVIASGSTLALKGRADSPREVGRELGVRYVLEGSVRKAGGRVRVTVQLIDASDGAQIWTERFEDTLEDVFALQDRVALAVAGKIEPTVQTAEIRRASARPTENMGSYDLFLRAQTPYLTLGKSGVAEALGLLNRAIALDPNFGLALAAAALCHYLIERYGWSDTPEIDRARAIELAHKALKVASDDAAVLGRAALVTAILEGERDAATALIDRALNLNPGSAAVWGASGMLRMRAGQTDLAIEHIETSMRLDPIGPSRLTQMAQLSLARFQQRRFGEAAMLSRQMAQHSDAPGPHACLSAIYGHLGQQAEAREALARYRERASMPIEDFGRRLFDDPASIRLFLDGIALAEGSPPAPDAEAE